MKVLRRTFVRGIHSSGISIYFEVWLSFGKRNMYELYSSSKEPMNRFWTEIYLEKSLICWEKSVAWVYKSFMMNSLWTNVNLHVIKSKLFGQNIIIWIGEILVDDSVGKWIQICQLKSWNFTINDYSRFVIVLVYFHMTFQKVTKSVFQLKICRVSKLLRECSGSKMME